MLARCRRCRRNPRYWKNSIKREADPTPLSQLDAEHTAVRRGQRHWTKKRQHRIPGRPDARPLPGLLVRVLTVASLAQTTATHSPGQMLPVRLVPEFDVCAARFHWRLSSTAHCQEQHGDRKQNGDRGESFENCWHRVIFFTAVLRIRAVPVAVVAAFNFDRRPPRAVQPPARFEP